MAFIKTFLDWESAFGKSPSGRDVTLSKMTTEEYIRDPEFKVHGLGVQIEKETPFYLYKKDDLLHFLKTHPWDNTWAICHHSHFDLAILMWRCKISPRFIGDTLSMFRALYPHESASLYNMAKILELPPKGAELMSVKDKWKLTDEEQQMLGGYCCNDVDIASQAFYKMVKRFPVPELKLIDMTVRLFSEPALEVDRAVLIEEYKRERRKKRELIKSCCADKDTLASNDKFAETLLSVGIDPPKKLSPSKVKDGRVNPDEVDEAPRGILPSFKSTKGMTAEQKADLKVRKNAYPWSYAFGKNDEQFKLLLEHPDESVQALVEARMGVKSTIKETRSKRFYKIGSRGKFPVYQNYYGAKTGRFSGGDKQNTTNLNRVNPDDPTSGALRRSLLAPPGHILCVRDLSQIEARVLAYWAGQDDLVELFRQGGDPYNRQASQIFGYEVDRKKEEFYIEGLAGKASVLGCFGPDTLVLTDNGWKPITDVELTDKVWDGVEYVSHEGVLDRGEKRCIAAYGITATPDHKILAGRSWCEWQYVHAKHYLFHLALQRARLPPHPDKCDKKRCTVRKNPEVRKKKLTTYDIACAGPRQRFTVMTDCGPILVHNCGYGMGWSKFQESLRIGFMGMPPLIFDFEAAKKLGVSVDLFRLQRSYKKEYATLEEEALALKPLNIGADLHLCHCACVKHIVDQFRYGNDAIKASWKYAGEALKDIVDGVRTPVGIRCPVYTQKDGLVLPNGMVIRYHHLKANASGEYRYLSNRKKQEYSYLYGGKAVENIIQALARIVMTDQMLRIEKNLSRMRKKATEVFKVVTSTYDEVVSCIPDWYADECSDMMKLEMSIPPPWCADLPLKSSGGYARSYGDCK